MSISDLYRATGAPGVLPARPGEGAHAPAQPKPGAGPSDFQKALDEQQALNFSQHAETRIRSRAIPWDEHLEARVKNGLDTAQAKGSREALILADNVAVIANVKSRTIVTAMDRSQMKEKIFTNIDSAVLV